MRITRLSLTLLASIIASGWPTSAPEIAPTEPPDWFRAQLEFLTRDGGRWTTDNTSYRSDDEPFDAYGTHWTWGIGQQGLRGELYGLRDGKKVATFWEFRTYWDPETKKARLLQRGGDGTVAHGTAEPLGENGERSEETFTRPDGTSYRVGHESTREPDGTHTTQSFDIDADGKWTKRRLYRWKRQPELTPGSIR